jgi:hypothetical protein
MSKPMSKNQVMITAVAVWAMLLAASFAFFLWLNNATGQMDWQQFQAMRDAKAKEKASRPHHAD